MAKYIFTLPDIGEGIAEAEIVKWHVALGDMIVEDQPIADMMTDKATVEMETPVTGKIIKVAGEEGDVIAIGSMLIEIEVAEGEGNQVYNHDSSYNFEEDADTETLSNSDAMPSNDTVKRPDITELEQPKAPVTSAASEPISLSPASFTPASFTPASSAKITASAAVRARAKSLGVDLSMVKTAGPHVRHADLDAYLSYGASQGYASASASRPDEAIKVIGMRRKIAENMINSKRTIPHFTYVEEIDVTDLEAMRNDLNDNRGERPKITMLPLLIVAIGKAIPDFPMINAIYDDETGVVTRRGVINMGIATQTESGLKVPVIHDAHTMNIWQLSNEIKILSKASRDNSISVNKLQGATLTVTSLGPLGGIATTPVINKPEVAIIGPNKIVERPLIVAGEIVARKLMNLSISCDHRVVDGYDAASFVQAVKKLLETPVLLFAD